MEFLMAFAALLIGVILTYLYLNKSNQSKLTELQIQLESEKQIRYTVQEAKSRLEEKTSILERDLNTTQLELKSQIAQAQQFSASYSGQKERNDELEKRLSSLKDETERLQKIITEQNQKLQTLSADFAGQKERNDGLQRLLEDQKTAFEESKEHIKNEIRHLSSTILEEKSQKFTEQNSVQLKQILEPLGLRIDEFKKKVEDTYSEENKDRATLKEQIRNLSELNKQMSQEAQNLTKALKGDSKTQGNWGEVILERILEKSGLRKGLEFEVQVTERNEDDKMVRPDVIVRLPDNKCMIIDSKVSLTAYEQYVNADVEEIKQSAMRMHLVSLKGHIKGLSDKKYQELHGIQSPDFVLLFIPIQSAFDVAMMHDPELYNLAFEKNIILVSPTTLLATLSTVNSVWKQEYQNRNAMQIADRGAKIYDKLFGFVEDLEKIGKALNTTQKAYDDALNKLSTGKGNLLNQTESLKKLGVNPSKKLSDKFDINPTFDDIAEE